MPAFSQFSSAYPVQERPEAALVEDLKLSNDPTFEAKFWDVIGLDLEPPEKALVFDNHGRHDEDNSGRVRRSSCVTIKVGISPSPNGL